ADQLGLPMYQLFSPEAAHCRRPLLSIKLSEFACDDAERLEAIVDDWGRKIEPRLFLHDYTATPVEAKLLRRAKTVYCGNEALVAELQPLHEQVVEAWCPGYLFDALPFPEE